ncbi:UPF0187-domain-containing protein [Xylariaceae sp. FL1272]|nr:UPF0187-domain-containing protein [Xylariaceae sp. FL1272]
MADGAPAASGGDTSGGASHGAAPSAPGASHDPAGGHAGPDHHGQNGPNGHAHDGDFAFTEKKTMPPQPSRRNTATPNPFSRRNTSIDLDDYFSGPRDLTKHSKWPLFMQLHGSITPKMIVPLLVVGAWASIITVVSKTVPGVNLGIESILLTITGFVVSMGLSFRSSSAYERYAEGRRYWSQLILSSQALGRAFWVNALERPDHIQEDILGKLTAMNLIVAFAVSLKHKLRFEPYTHYDDIMDLVDHIDTLAKEATQEDVMTKKKMGIFHTVGENLGLSFAASNPRKMIKRSKRPLGNLPLEILCYLTAYADELVANQQLPVGMTQTAIYNAIGALNDSMVNAERILNTPLPLAYAIAISQITWLYVFLLPFQLYKSLGWITIPATIVSSFLILSIFFIGHEIENPFGTDVNDLPLEHFCEQVVLDMETISCHSKIKPSDFIKNSRNKVMFPFSTSNYYSWETQSEGAIRAALKERPNAPFQKMASRGTESV